MLTASVLGAGVPIGFVVFVLLHIPLCYWFVGMLKKRRAMKMKVFSPLFMSFPTLNPQ